MLFANCCFAFQDGIGYSPNVYNGSYSYPFINFERLNFTTVYSNGNHWHSDLPISDKYAVRELSSLWVGFGEPLNMNTTSQTLVSNNAFQGFVNPKNVDSTYDYSISMLDSVFNDYKDNENVKSQIDACRWYLQKNDNSAYRDYYYQRVDASISDFVVTRDMLYGKTNDRYNSYLYDIIFRGYCKHNSLGFEQRAYVSFNASGLNSVTNTIVDYSLVNEPVDLGDRFEWYDVYNTYLVQMPLLSYIRSKLPEEFSSSEFISLRDIHVHFGDYNSIPPDKDYTNVYKDAFAKGGFEIVDIYQMCLRPYDKRLNTIEALTSANHPSATDIHYKLNNGYRNSLSSDIDISGVGNFVSNTVGGILDTAIIPGITLGGILFTVVAIGFIVVALKYFAGG